MSVSGESVSGNSVTSAGTPCDMSGIPFRLSRSMLFTDNSTQDLRQYVDNEVLILLQDEREENGNMS